MNYSCLSCRAKYVIPDSRVAAAGLEGLRVRCSRCRAIMAVTTSMGATRRQAAPKQAASTTPMTTGVMANPFAAMALPMSMGADGPQALATSRDITGVFVSSSSEPVPALGAQHFFAAIAGRSRGPYTAKELVMLADKGRIRAGTLVWRPGASGWKPLKQVTDFDVSWLRDAVSRRKQREQEAEDMALKRRGISPIRLERHSSSRRPLLPALPADAWDNALHDAPSAIPQLVGGTVSSQFEWRAPTPTGAEPRSRALRLASAVGVAVALGLTLAALFR